jgi:5S rRNA maturation endonuclease (ribonuclease M5)
MSALDQAATIAQKCQQARRIGDRWQCLCPSHDDTQASLSIRAREDRVLMHCHAGCDTKTILAMLGFTERDLFVASNGNGHTPTNGHKTDTKSRIIARYRYVDAEGRLLFETARMEPKSFRQLRPDPDNPGKWLWNLDSIKPVLYKLPEVLKAVQGRQTVYVVEGEKDVDALTALGLTATCNPMGAGKWRDSYSETLRGAQVVILPDNDKPGKNHAAMVAASLHGKAASVKVVELPRLPPKGDVSDWLKAGGDRVQLEAIVKTTAMDEHDTRQVIQIGPDITRMVDEGEAALLALPHGPVLFQRARRLSIIARGVKSPRWLHRPEDAPVIAEVQPAYLDELAAQAARWEKYDKRAKQWDEVNPPSRFVKTLQARPSWQFPVLEGIIHSPTIRPDGSILDTPGYDADTGLFFDSNGTRFPVIPPHVGLDVARSAIGRLQEVVQDFPFEKPWHFSAWLSAVLSVVCRYTILGCVPMHGITATTRGSGKSLLADTIALIGTGHSAARWSQVFDEDEERKRLLSLALDGDPLVCIDNITAPLGSGALALALTASSIKDRILGTNQTKEAPFAAVFLCTGNNVQYVGDVARRVVPIALDPKMERPEERTDFLHPDLPAWVQSERPRLTIAALSIVKAYFDAGCPSQGLTPLGSFEPWSNLIRHALVWAGEADPCEGRKDIEATSNPEFETLAVLLHTWHACYASRAVTLKEVVQNVTSQMQHVGPESAANEWNELYDALSACDERYDGRRLDVFRIGQALREWQGRIIDGKRLVTPGRDRTKTTLWRVETV